MDTNPLPNLDSDQSDSDPGVTDTYVIRLTSHGKFTFEQLHEFIHNEPMFCRYVVGRETVPQEHFHLVVVVDPSFTMDDVRGCIRAFIIPFWETPDHRLPRGFGNKQYNLQESIDLDKAVSYAVKCAEFKFEGFEESYILERQAQSYEKKTPSNFRSEYRDLCLKFQETPDMDIRVFMIDYCNLKAKYDQQVNLSQAYAFALSQEMKRDKTTELHVENYLYNR